jgi:hypothetical protein
VPLSFAYNWVFFPLLFLAGYFVAWCRFYSIFIVSTLRDIYWFIKNVFSLSCFILVSHLLYTLFLIILSQCNFITFNYSVLSFLGEDLSLLRYQCLYCLSSFWRTFLCFHFVLYRFLEGVGIHCCPIMPNNVTFLSWLSAFRLSFVWY